MNSFPTATAPCGPNSKPKPANKSGSPTTPYPRAIPTEHEACANAQAAQAADHIVFTAADALDAEPNGENGLLIANPPYGERLSDSQTLHALYPQFAARLKQYYAGWTAALFSGDMELPRLMRLKPRRKIPLYNGKLDCRLFLFDMVAGSNRN